MQNILLGIWLVQCSQSSLRKASWCVTQEKTLNKIEEAKHFEVAATSVCLFDKLRSDRPRTF